MKYEPIKERISSAVGESAAVRKLLYSVLNIILLRTWHVKREIRKVFKTTKLKKVLDARLRTGTILILYCKKIWS